MNHQFKSKLVYHGKLGMDCGLIQEIKIWDVRKTKKYPEGVKYSLVLVDPKNGRILLLFDNHYPKGHHQHYSDGSERPYKFTSVHKLISDFLKLKKREVKKYENS